MNLLIGGYRTSQVLHCQLCTNTRTVTYLNSLEIGTANASWLTKVGKYLFVVGENEAGSLSSFALKDDLSSCSLISHIEVDGAAPCHICPVCVSSTSSSSLVADFMFVSNYESGSLSIIPLDASGNLLNQKKIVIASNASSQKLCNRGGPHVHNTERFRGFVYVVDLGMDFIFQYPVLELERLIQEPSREALSKSTAEGLQLPPGCGPRHIKFHPCGYLAAVLNEVSNTVMLLEVDPTTGVLSLLKNEMPERTALESSGSINTTNAPANSSTPTQGGLLLSLWLFANILVQRLFALPPAVIATSTIVSIAIAYFLFPSMFSFLRPKPTANPHKPDSTKDTNCSQWPTCLSTLRPKEVDANGVGCDMNAAELCFSQNGKFLYVSNRDVRPSVMGLVDGDVDRSSIAVFRLHGVPVVPPAKEAAAAAVSITGILDVEPSPAPVASRAEAEEEEYVLVSNKSTEDLKSSPVVPTKMDESVGDSLNSAFPTMDDPARPRPKGIPIFLELLQHVFTRGNHPRHFQLVCQDSLLLVANQTSENIVCFKVDTETGLIDDSSAVSSSFPQLTKPAFILPL